jgi:hypothetical protein
VTFLAQNADTGKNNGLVKFLGKGGKRRYNAQEVWSKNILLIPPNAIGSGRGIQCPLPSDM